MLIGKTELEIIFRVANKENYEMIGQANSYGGLHIRCKNCGASRDYEEYEPIEHTEDCLTSREEQIVKEIRKYYNII